MQIFQQMSFIGSNVYLKKSSEHVLPFGGKSKSYFLDKVDKKNIF